MATRADAAASALGWVWESWSAVIEGGWFERRDGLFASVTGVPLAGFNGVWTERNDFDQRAFEELLDYVAASGVPFCVQVRPGCSERAAAAATARGMTMPSREPLMILDDPSRIEAAQRVEGLTIRELDPDEASAHNAIATLGFGISLDLLERMITPAILRTAGTRFYVGEWEGIAVTTGTGVTNGPSVGIFNIATPEEYRGRGFGAAVTARAVSDGLADGAEWSFLQSSQLGFEVYKRLGYSVVELWDCWISG